MTETSTYRSRYVDLDGTRVRYVSHSGPADGPTFVLVHGLGGSLENWLSLIPLLAQRGRVLAPDLGGFGMTGIGDKSAASIQANLGLLDRFLQEVCDRPAIVAGNSMGGMLTAQLAARTPRRVAGAVLIDPALPPSPLARPHPVVVAGFSVYVLPGFDVWAMRQREQRYTPAQLVEQTMRLVTTHFDRIDPAVVRAHLELTERRAVEFPDSDEAFAVAARSLLRQFARRGQFSHTLHQILQPVLLLHGDRDHLINVKSARAVAARHPSWTYVEGADRGHTPFLDFPEWCAEHMLTWLDAHPQVEQRARGTS